MNAFYAIVLGMLLTAQGSAAQSVIVAGPMLGYTELRTARLWVEVQPGTTKLWIQYRQKAKGEKSSKTDTCNGAIGKEFPTALFTLASLDPGTTYDYELFCRKWPWYTRKETRNIYYPGPLAVPEGCT